MIGRGDNGQESESPIEGVGLGALLMKGAVA